MRVDNASKSSHSVVTQAKAVKPRPAFPITHPMQQRTFFMLLVTSTIYVPAQHCDAVRVLALPRGCTVETVGFDVSSATLGPLQQPPGLLQRLHAR